MTTGASRSVDAVTTTQLRVGALTFDALTAGPDDGAPVLLLHGFPRSARLWARQLAALSIAGHRVVALDQRGYAPRARPSDDHAYQLAALGGDVTGIADALGWRRFHLVGHDWGGMVAWWVAANHAARLLSLSVLSTAHPAAYHRALATFDQRRRTAYVPLLTSAVAPRLLGARNQLGLRALFIASGLPPAHRRVPLERARRDPGLLPAALAWYRANDLAGLRDIGDIDVPTLYVWGTADAALGPQAAYWTGDHVTGPYRFVALPAMGHWLPELAADTVNRLLAAHVADHT